jgi:F-box domain
MFILRYFKFASNLTFSATQITTQRMLQAATEMESIEKKLPREIIHTICKHIRLIDYIHLRKCCRTLAQLKRIPVLSAISYHKSSMSIFPNRHDMENNPRMHLDLDDLCKESFLRILFHNHSHEVIRLLICHRKYQITPEVKQEALTGIMREGGPAAVAIELLKDDRVDPSIMVPFSCGGRSEEVANALMWSAYEGHIDLLRILMKDPRVDIFTDVDELGDCTGTYMLI